MADVAAGLLQARRCIHGVAEERDFHLDGAEFANDHGPAMKRGAEVRPEAEVANVGVGAFVQLLQRVEAGADEANEIRVSAERSRRRNSVGLNAGGMGWVRPGSMDFSSGSAGS